MTIRLSTLVLISVTLKLVAQCKANLQLAWKSQLAESRVEIRGFGREQLIAVLEKFPILL